ncbi:hypothetical protein ACT4ML_09050 [Natrinema sp. LN54]|uniref:hypothetical protein n=1 Tax=Natrinema sp. LN54 TaxID=3458705 RepID=UPI0040358683
MVTRRRERAQVILIGAVSLAFIILGIVVVFNGVLYTETLSSGGTSQSASDADVIEHEINQSIGCLLVEVEDQSGASDNSTLEDQAVANISAFNTAYQNTTAHSTPAAVNIRDVEATANSDPTLENVNVTVVYDSNSLSHRRDLTIQPRCP